MTLHADLHALSDDALLARLRSLQRGCAERDAIGEILVGRYRKLVSACVRQYRGSPEPPEDLMQVGYVGLLKAINNYDPAYGDSLMAYARPRVTGEIKRHFRDKRWQMRVPRQSQELLLEMRAAEEGLSSAVPPTTGNWPPSSACRNPRCWKRVVPTWSSAPTLSTHRSLASTIPPSSPRFAARSRPCDCIGGRARRTIGSR